MTNHDHITSPLLAVAGESSGEENNEYNRGDSNVVLFSCRPANYVRLSVTVPLVFAMLIVGGKAGALFRYPPHLRMWFLRQVLWKYIMFDVVNLCVLGVFYAWRFPQWIQLRSPGTISIVSYWRRWDFSDIQSLRHNPSWRWMGVFRHILTDFGTGFQTRVIVKTSSTTTGTRQVIVTPENLQEFMAVAQPLVDMDHGGTALSVSLTAGSVDETRIV